jgi:hypothetical protein
MLSRYRSPVRVVMLSLLWSSVAIRIDDHWLSVRTETSTSCSPHKTSSGVAEDNENGLGRLFGSRRNADPLGKGHKFRQGPNLHFLHHPVAMGLDGTLGTA